MFLADDPSDPTRRVPPRETLRVEERSIRGDGPVTYRSSHDWITIVALLNGSCHVEFSTGFDRHRSLLGGDRTLRLAGADVLRLRKRASGSGPAQVALIELHFRHVRDWPRFDGATTGRGPAELRTQTVVDPIVTSMAPELIDALSSGADNNYADNAARYLASHLAHPHPDSRRGRPGLSPEQLLAVTTFMREHIAARITVEELAKEAALSRYHFIRQFATATGRTPVRYLTEMRLDTARRLLATSDRSIADVGRRCGFPHAEHFARVFRKHAGCSPSHYRQRSDEHLPT